LGGVLGWRWVPLAGCWDEGEICKMSAEE
jgi:hypothetical protein